MVSALPLVSRADASANQAASSCHLRFCKLIWAVGQQLQSNCPDHCSRQGCSYEMSVTEAAYRSCDLTAKVSWFSCSTGRCLIREDTGGSLQAGPHRLVANQQQPSAISSSAAGSSLRLKGLSGRLAGCACSQHKRPHLRRNTPAQLPS